MLFSVTWRRSETSCLERWSIGFWILSVALVMASCIGIVVHRDIPHRGCMDKVTLCLW